MSSVTQAAFDVGRADEGSQAVGYTATARSAALSNVWEVVRSAYPGAARSDSHFFLSLTPSGGTASSADFVSLDLTTSGYELYLDGDVFIRGIRTIDDAAVEGDESFSFQPVFGPSVALILRAGNRDEIARLNASEVATLFAPAGGITFNIGAITGTIVDNDDDPRTSPVTLDAINEDSGPLTITQVMLLANATDPDLPAQTLTASNLQKTSGNGNLTDNGNGTWTYTPALDDDTAVAFRYGITDGSASVAGTASLNLLPVNDAPTLDIPETSRSTNEDQVTALTGITVADVDAGSSALEMTAWVLLGGGELAATSSGDVTVGVKVVGSARGLTLTGTTTALNSFIADGKLTYTPAPNFTGPVSVRLEVIDQGNTGEGGEKFDVKSINLSFRAVNDAPVHTLPDGGITVVEDQATALTGISVADVDAGSSNLRMTLLVTAGTLAATGVVGVTVGGTPKDLRLTGTATALNDFIANNQVRYTTEPNAKGTVALKVHTTDLGHSGSGGELIDQDEVVLNITPVNDAPVAGDDFLSTDEDTVLWGNLLLANGGAAADSDLDGDALTISMINVNGSSANVGVPIELGNGWLTVQANGAFSFDPRGPNGGYESLKDQLVRLGFNYTVSDGQGGSDTAFVGLNVLGRNDAPTLTQTSLPSATTTEDATYTTAGSALLAGAGAQDVESGDPMNLVITAASGASGVWQYSVGGQVWMDLRIPVPGYGVLLSAATQIRFVPNGMDGGTAALSFIASNFEFNSVDGVMRSTDVRGIRGGTHPFSLDEATLKLDITPVNDAPVHTLPAGGISVTEDVPSPLTGIRVDDVDAGSSPLVMTLKVLAGTLAATSSGGVTVGGNALALTLTGNTGALNSFLDSGSVTYQTAPNANGKVELTVNTDDQGKTGSGGAQFDEDVVNLNIIAVNDAPTLHIAEPARRQEEDQSTALTGITVADVDAGSSDLEMTIGGYRGVLAATGSDGVIVNHLTLGGLSLTGTITALNAFIAGGKLSYTPVLNFTGSETLNVTVNDHGNTGSGGFWTDVETLVLVFGAVNDPPVHSLPPSGITVVEDQATALTGIRVDDVDAGSSPLVMTLSVLAGTLAATGSPGVTVDGTGTGTLTLTGAATALNNFIAARQVSYTTARDANDSVTLTVHTTDQGSTGAGSPQIDQDTVALNIQAVNDAPPVAVPDAAQTRSNTAVNIAVLANDSDFDGSPLSVASFGQGGNGSVAIGLNSQSVTYTPNPGFAGFDNFSYTVSDGQGGLTSANVSVLVVSRLGTAFNDSLQGTSAADYMLGLGGRDTLRGLGGNDTIDGGNGNDTLYGGEGNDDLRGGEGNDVIYGDAGADTVYGGAGNDWLYGGPAGPGDGTADTFVFNTALDAVNNVDWILNFEANGLDRIALDSTIFAAVAANGTPGLDAGEFASVFGGVALDANDFIVFDPTDGKLYYDADGAGPAARVQFAQVSLFTGVVDASDLIVGSFPG